MAFRAGLFEPFRADGESAVARGEQTDNRLVARSVDDQRFVVKRNLLAKHPRQLGEEPVLKLERLDLRGGHEGREADYFGRE
jgi:hypothetical protein